MEEIQSILFINDAGQTLALQDHCLLKGRYIEDFFKKNSIESITFGRTSIVTDREEKAKPIQSSKWKSSKLWAAAIVFATASVAMFTGFLSGPLWTGIAVACLGIYTGQKAWQNIKLGGVK